MFHTNHMFVVETWTMCIYYICKYEFYSSKKKQDTFCYA